ncbi:MAG: PEP-CTERM sorting domain-containing protein [Planctomycetia bacterium]|nr:PEP-CTERM sorting domain-containing protein [Planctomycetia bacterium]
MQRNSKKQSIVLMTAAVASTMLATHAGAAVVFTNIADTTTTAPGHGTFNGFSIPPSVSGSNVAFIAQYSGGSGIYSGTVGATGAAKIVDTTDTAPGHGAFGGFPGFGPVALSVSGGSVAFRGSYSGGNGVYTGTVGSTGAIKMVDTTDSVPGQGVFTGFGFGTPSVSGSHVAFLGNHSGGSGVYIGTVGATGATKIVDTTDTAPGHGVFGGFGSIAPSLSGSNAAFIGNYSGGNGIYIGTVGSTGAAKIVDTTDTAPGHGAFIGFGTPSVSGSNVAFLGNYGDGTGIFTGTVGSTGAAKIVDTTDAAPGHGAFTSFNLFSVSGSNVAFLGNYSSGSGIYLEIGGAGGILTPVANTGDALFGSTVTSLSLGSFGYDNNTIAFNYFLANGRSGIATAVVPEPASLALLGMSAAMVLTWARPVRRRRLHNQ